LTGMFHLRIKPVTDGCNRHTVVGQNHSEIVAQRPVAPLIASAVDEDDRGKPFLFFRQLEF
jgi:hypothetical protein